MQENYQEMRDIAISEWIRRHGGLSSDTWNRYYVAPLKSSLTKLLMEMIENLQARIVALETRDA